MRGWLISSIVVSILNFAGLGLLYYKLEHVSRQFPTATLETAIKNEAEIQTQLALLQKQLAQSLPLANLPSGIADLLPDRSDTATNSSNTFITISSDWPAPVKVHKEQADYSAVLGQLIPDYKYPYYTKLDGWYLVSLDGQTGWVNAVGVFENP